MRELIPVVRQWFDAGHQVALATVVKVYGSAPQGLGAKMVVNDAGVMAGSVSGGCVEGAVVAEALQILQGAPARLISYGISDDQAYSVGLACGGIIEVFIEPFDRSVFTRMQTEIENDHMFVRVVVLKGTAFGESSIRLPDQPLQNIALPHPIRTELETKLEASFQDQQSSRLSIREPEESEILLDVFVPRARLFIVGAVHIAIPLVHFARMLGFYCVVIDPRKAFSNPERFPHADELVHEWPDIYLEQANLNEGSYVAVISHDEKLDVPALTAACRSKAFYIGALGSKTTFEKNVAGLRENGVAEADIARINSPIGLAIGARGAQEIALAIVAQMISVKNGQKKN